ncbi:ATP synthase A chain family protein, partial [Mycobacterium ulcerans str. Harvey]
FRPAGLGVVFGLALFQLLLVASTALPVWKKLRTGTLRPTMRRTSPSARIVAFSRDRKGVPPAMTASILAAQIEVGEHHTATWLCMTVNTDTVLSTAIAALIVLALAFYLRSKVTSTAVPGGVQLFFEAITIQMRGQVESAIGMRIAPFVLPLAVTIFVFILISNWLSVLRCSTRRTRADHRVAQAAAADINYVLALALFVFVCYHAAGIWRRGIVGHPSSCSRAVAILAPINLVEESPSRSRCRCVFSAISLPAAFGRAHRALPALHHVGAECDLEVLRLVRRRDSGLHFALLTILYFSQAMELEEDHH